MLKIAGPLEKFDMPLFAAQLREFKHHENHKSVNFPGTLVAM
jgi:hypothetical protein